MQIDKKNNKMCQNHTFMGQFSIEKPRKMLYDTSMKYYDAEVRMKKQYEKMGIELGGSYDTLQIGMIIPRITLMQKRNPSGHEIKN